jgi:hypothetical protein
MIDNYCTCCSKLIRCHNLFYFSCLRRLTFVQQQTKVSKKCRPSSAGKADFPQKPSVGVQSNLAYEGRLFYPVDS